MNSSKEPTSRLLAKEVDAFLLEFANARDITRVQRHFIRFLPPSLKYGSWVNILRGQKSRLGQTEADLEELSDYQRSVQAVWTSATEGQRRYWAFKLRAKLYEALEQKARLAVPQTVRRVAKGKWERVQPWKPEYGDLARNLESTLFEQALNRLDDLGKRTVVCGNPDCPARFFIAIRKSQKYCTEKCAGVFQQKAKRDWWRQHGKEWREQRRVRSKAKNRS